MRLTGVSYNPKTGVICRDGKPVTTTDSQGYKRLQVERKSIRQHRVAWYLAYGYWPKEVDHINGDKSDNRLNNLRECTRSTNMLNRPAQSNNKLGVKNVWWHKQAEKYALTIKGKHIGLFDTVEEAVKRRDEYALRS